MSDGPYRAVEDLGTAAIVDGDGLVLDRYKWNELGRIKADEIASFLNAAHRAASEKARRVVEAARAALKDMDDNGDSIVSDPDKDRLRQALADYDRA